MELPRTAVAVAAPEEVGESPVALVEAAILLRCLLEAGRRSLAAEWAHGVANAGTAAIGTAIGVAIGTVVAISMTMTTLIMRSSLAASRSGAGVGGIRTDIPATAMATHTVMATHTDTGPHTAIITAAPVTEMAGTAAIGTAIGVAGAGVAATGTAAIGVASAGVAATGTGVRPKSV